LIPLASCGWPCRDEAQRLTTVRVDHHDDSAEGVDPDRHISPLALANLVDRDGRRIEQHPFRI
jgi:hypothetical protein